MSIDRPPVETEFSALQALLQIRTDSSGGEGNNAGDATSRIATAASTTNERQLSVLDGTTADATAFVNAKVTGVLCMGSSTTPEQLSFSPAQLSALRAAASSVVLQDAALAATTATTATAATSGTLHHATPLQSPTSAARSSIYLSPFSHAVGRDPGSALALFANGRRSPARDWPRSALSPDRPAFNSDLSKGGTISPATQKVDRDRNEVGTASSECELVINEKKVRKDEVEAALRSKPQRGRKRENLNAEERLELTRTRNREHAKSTRIRKKARYQELLDTEQKYQDLKRQEELDNKRRKSILGFLDVRGQMLRMCAEKNGRKNKKASLDNNNDSKELTEDRVISFDQADALGAGPVAEINRVARVGEKTDHIILSLDEFLANEAAFVFEASLSDVHIHGANAMARFDECVAHRLDHLCGRSAAVCHVRHRVVGSEDGVALNKNGTGFACVEHVVAANCTSMSHEPPPAPATGGPQECERTVMSSLVSFRYSDYSALIRSVSWCVMSNYTVSSACDSVCWDKSVETPHRSLKSNTLCPTVFFLDEAHRDGDTARQI